MGLRLQMVLALGLALGSLVGCGGAGSVDFFDAAGGSGSAGRNAAGTASNGAGASNLAGSTNIAGASNAAGAASAGEMTVANAGAPSGAGAATSGPSDEPCSPVTDITNNSTKMSGELDTEGPACLLIKGNIVGWGCSNFEGRTLKVNGVEVRCAELPLPDQLHGGYYFDVSAGDHAYASLYWY